MKSTSKLSFAISFVLMTVAGIVIWNKIRDFPHKPNYRLTSEETKYSANVTGKNASHISNVNSANTSITYEKIATKPLLLPSGHVLKDTLEREMLPARVIASDDSIMYAGGVQLSTSVSRTHEEIESREKRLESISAKHWNRQSNLLVNEIRASRGFLIEMGTIENFLAGKEMQGWTESQRNWIGDELMIMLRQEAPQEAYRIFQQVLADESAPAAMRDYSVQHISHLVSAGQVGKEGVAVIRAALESGDPIYASTALMALHRLSATHSHFVSPQEVVRFARDRVETGDLRMQLSTRAIVQESEQLRQK